MADFLSPEWWDQAGKDIARVFEGDKAVESDRVSERDKVSEEVVAVDGPQKKRLMTSRVCPMDMKLLL